MADAKNQMTQYEKKVAEVSFQLEHNTKNNAKSDDMYKDFIRDIGAIKTLCSTQGKITFLEGVVTNPVAK